MIFPVVLGSCDVPNLVAAYNFRCTAWYHEDHVDRMDYQPQWLNDSDQGLGSGSDLHKAFQYVYCFTGVKGANLMFYHKTITNL